MKTLNIRMIIKVLGILLLVESLFMFTGIPFAVYYHESIQPLLISGIITLISGFVFWVSTLKKTKMNIGKREGFMIVTLAWIIISLFGTLPYLLSQSIHSFTNAFFETISGFTTTGSSILNDVEILPKSMLYWRALTHWIGGMGIIVLTVAILPFLGVGGMQLFVAEMPGITPDKLHPRITGTAKRFWGIYVLLTVVEVLLLYMGGMDFFNSLCHSFATLATGGFSTSNTSIAGLSPYIQYVITFFMILAGTNFTLHYFALHLKFNRLRHNEEYRMYLTLIILFSLALTVGLIVFMGEGLEPAFRHALFTVSSILTTTGFVTSNYVIWPSYMWMLVFALMFFGGMAGSTGGGIKIIRHILLIKNSRLELKRSLHPHAVIPVKYNGRTVNQQIIFNVMAFFLIYLFFFAVGTFVMGMLGLDFETAIGASIASLGNIGPGIGGVGPVENYAFIPDAGKWMLSFLMIMGRLELFTVLVVFSPAFWK